MFYSIPSIILTSQARKPYFLPKMNMYEMQILVYDSLRINGLHGNALKSKRDNLNESPLEVLRSIISIIKNLGYHKTIQPLEKSTAKVSISLCKEDFSKLWEDLLNQDSLTILFGIRDKIFQRTKSLLC